MIGVSLIILFAYCSTGATICHDCKYSPSGKISGCNKTIAAYVANWEGCCTHQYYDTQNISTIGIGFKMDLWVKAIVEYFPSSRYTEAGLRSGSQSMTASDISQFFDEKLMPYYYAQTRAVVNKIKPGSAYFENQCCDAQTYMVDRKYRGALFTNTMILIMYNFWQFAATNDRYVNTKSCNQALTRCESNYNLLMKGCSTCPEILDSSGKPLAQQLCPGNTNCKGTVFRTTTDICKSGTWYPHGLTVNFGCPTGTLGTGCAYDGESGGFRLVCCRYGVCNAAQQCSLNLPFLSKSGIKARLG